MSFDFEQACRERLERLGFNTTCHLCLKNLFRGAFYHDLTPLSSAGITVCCCDCWLNRDKVNDYLNLPLKKFREKFNKSVLVIS